MRDHTGENDITLQIGCDPEPIPTGFSGHTGHYDERGGLIWTIHRTSEGDIAYLSAPEGNGDYYEVDPALDRTAWITYDQRGAVLGSYVSVHDAQQAATEHYEHPGDPAAAADCTHCQES